MTLAATAAATTPTPSYDPLEHLPPELVLRVLDHLALSTLACLLRTSSSWNTFIDHVHCEPIYASKVTHERRQTYTGYFTGVVSSKQLCERQTRLRSLLRKGFTCPREDTLIPTPANPNNSTWRFRPDFERRLVLSTAEFGGLYVNDMDDKKLLWSLQDERLGPFTHLEYSEGFACFNRALSESIEVWRIVEEPRGHMQHVASLPHTVRTRGFHCRWPHLCVVSDQGKGFVYDLARSGPNLLMTDMNIQEDAYGHVDQNDEVVMWSMGTKGYHIHSKRTGQLLGTLNPAQATRTFHIKHPPRPSNSHRMAILQNEAHPGGVCPNDHCFAQVPIETGRHPCPRVVLAPNEDDEWGAGMFMGDAMIGISRRGRVFITAHWRQSMLSYGWTSSLSVIVECQSSSFDFERGGWLAVKNGRALVEVYDRVYIIPLPRSRQPPDLVGEHAYAVLSTIIPPPSLPISWMGLFDDCLMFTQIMPIQWERGGIPARFTKAIKILTFAPPTAKDMHGN